MLVRFIQTAIRRRAATIEATIELEDAAGCKNTEQLWARKMKFIQGSQDEFEKAAG